MNRIEGLYKKTFKRLEKRLQRAGIDRSFAVMKRHFFARIDRYYNRSDEASFQSIPFGLDYSLKELV